MIALRPLVALAALLASGCTHLPVSSRPRAAPTVDAPPESYYDAGGEVPAPLRTTTKEEHRDWTLEEILLPPRVPPPLSAVPRAEDPIEILHFRPRRADRVPRPLILISPILGNTNLLVGQFAIDFARAGFHAAIVQRKELAFDPSASMEQAEEEVRLVVMRSRQALDWFLTRSDVDPERVGTFGISAGAIVGSMLAGSDARPSAHVWMLAGGPLVDVMVDTSEDRFRDYARETIRTTGLGREAIRARLRREIRTDPLRLAPRVRREDVLLVLARHDSAVPFRYGLALWEALGRPERVVTPLGHYTTFLLLPWLQTKAREFFEARFPDR